MFEKILKRQINAFLSSGHLISDHQAGFRQGQGVKSALLRVFDDISAAVDRKSVAVMLLLDFSKAFDTISHQRLCQKLRARFFFDLSAVSLVRSYLTGREQSVFCNDILSDAIAVLLTLH